MKRYLHSLAAAMILMLPLASCDKDNNSDDPDPSPTPNPITPTAQLSSLEYTEIEAGYDDIISKYEFQYNEENKIKSIRNNETWGSSVDNRLTEFYWNPFSITIDGHKINVNLSSAGYITYANPWESPESLKFEYDNKDHLTRITYTGDEYDYSEYDYVWKDDLLIEINSTRKLNARIITKEISTISYGDQVNQTGIWPASFMITSYLWITFDEFDGHACPCFSQIGLLGIAPTRLPMSCTEVSIEYNDNGTEIRRHESKYKITNQLDSKGRLSSENIEVPSMTYIFKYTYR